jgi:hypothetical protein
MGFDERFIPKVSEPMRGEGLRLTEVRSPADVAVAEVLAGSFERRELRLDELRTAHPFVPHAGWRGHIERAPS